MVSFNPRPDIRQFPDNVPKLVLHELLVPELARIGGQQFICLKRLTATHLASIPESCLTFCALQSWRIDQEETSSNSLAPGKLLL